MSTLMRDRRGSIAVTMALSLTVVIAVIGLGVDLGRIWLVQTRLQSAVDAGVLVAAKEMGSASAKDNANAKALFWADFGRIKKEDGNKGYLGASADVPVIEPVDADTVRMKANAIVPTTFVAALGIGAQTVHAEASARRATMGVELALVLDITGSMKSNDNIGALRSSATNLVNILYGSNETRPNLWVSVVPYTAAVNLGPKHTDWLEARSLERLSYPSTSGWAGCVEARGKDQDGTDTPPSSAPFTPYYWKSTLGIYSDSKGPVVGDNDWSPDPNSKNKITEKDQAKLPDNTAVGPNLGCPASPVLPLTASKARVLETINGPPGDSTKALQATFRGGTMTNVGLQAGWFTLSPNWRGLWGDKDLPLNYKTENMRKVLVMMTDGENNWFDWDGGAPGLAKSSTYTPNVGADADYTAYGRLSENRLGIAKKTIGDARVEIDARVAKLCKKVKDAGITVYTITFGVGSTDAQKLWRDCASTPDNYFNSPTKEALSAAFQQIGTQLASLRLTQ